MEFKKENILSEQELKILATLGKKIIKSLECNINGYDVPCRTDRFEVIRLMKEYLQIHQMRVVSE